MRIKKRGRTTEIKFDNRQESIAFLRAMGMNKSADALEAHERTAQQIAQPEHLLDDLCEHGFASSCPENCN